MKKYIFLVVIVLFFAKVSSSQTLDEIIDKHIQSHGGVEKWEKVEALKISGDFTAFSVQKNFQTIKTNKPQFHSSFSLGKHDVLEGFDGEVYWTIDPWQDINYARKLNKAEENMIQQKLEFFTPFYKYKEKGIEAELIGKVEVEGTETFKIKLKRKNGFEEVWYLNAETYLEYKCESMWVDFAYRSRAESFFDDFREVDGLIIPFYIERTFGQRSRITQITDVNINPEIDESLFKMPIISQLEKLTFLEGDWDVEINVWSARAKKLVAIDKSVSQIRFEYTHLLQEKISYEYYFPFEFMINYAYIPEIDKYRISVYNNFHISMEVLEGEFHGDTIVFDNSDLDLSKRENTNYTRFKYVIINEDKFEVELFESSAPKEDWQLKFKWVYSRVE